MTMPNQRAIAVLWARKLLKAVACCEDVPAHLRSDARHILRHYPLAHDVQFAADAAPHLFEVDRKNRITMQALQEAGNDDLY